MRKTIMTTLTATIALTLGACGDLDQDEVMEEVYEHNDEVESYHTLWELDVEVHDERSVDESTAKMDLDVVESDNAMKGTMAEGDDETGSPNEYYITNDTTYENEKGWGWDSYPNDEMGIDDVHDDLSIAYNKIATMLHDIEYDVDMETDDDFYIFSFDGSSQDVFEAQDEPYNLEVTGFNDDDINQDLTMKVNKDTFDIENIENTITAENYGGELEMHIEHAFSDINEVDPIDVPEKVKNEAEQAFK